MTICSLHAYGNLIVEVLQVSIWDSRTGEAQGCTQRLNTHAGNLPLYAVAADCSGNVLGRPTSQQHPRTARYSRQSILLWTDVVVEFS